MCFSRGAEVLLPTGLPEIGWTIKKMTNEENDG